MTAAQGRALGPVITAVHTRLPRPDWPEPADREALFSQGRASGRTVARWTITSRLRSGDWERVAGRASQRWRRCFCRARVPRILVGRRLAVDHLRARVGAGRAHSRVSWLRDRARSADARSRRAPMRLLGLVLIADAPGRLLHGLRQLADLIGGVYRPCGRFRGSRRGGSAGRWRRPTRRTSSAGFSRDLQARIEPAVTRSVK